MSYLKEKSFFFETWARDPKTGEPYEFAVVRFSGTEAISRLYEFEITLMAETTEIDMGAILSNPATLYLQTDKKLPVHGLISNFEVEGEIDGKVFFQARLVPKLWRLSLFTVSEVYLDQTFPEILTAVLTEGGLTADDYDLRLVRNYRRWSYVCQYQETHFSFISRWMEREGMYYFWEHTDTGAKLIITDTRIAHVDLPDKTPLYYAPPSGLGQQVQEQAVTRYLCRQQPIPARVILQDFNHRKTPPIVEGSFELPAKESAASLGEVRFYGEHVKNDDEAREYAQLRAEGILSRERVYSGESTAAFPRVGWFFDLEGHFMDTFNRKYLMTGIKHDGSQAALLIAGVQAELAQDEQRPFYRNSFEAMESDLQFRPEAVTPKPRFYGTINAKVEAEGSGEYAELDEFGRYKVKIPFDRSDRTGQKASRWIRMAQPYGGPDEGMHFPLRKGAEVLLTFMDGDPDRPLIAAAVPGREGQSMVNAYNSQFNMLKSAGGNLMHMFDQRGQQRILMNSPTANSWVRIGFPNDPPDPYVVTEGDDLASHADSEGTWDLYVSGSKVASKTAALADDNTQVTYKVGDKKFYIGNIGGAYKYINWDEGQMLAGQPPVIDSVQPISGMLYTLKAAPTLADGDIAAWTFERYQTTAQFDFYVANIGGVYKVMDWDHCEPLRGSPPAVDSVQKFAGKDYKVEVDPTTADGKIVEWTFYLEKQVTLNVLDEAFADTGHGIRMRSDNNIWLEAQKRYGEYMIGGPAERDEVPEGIRYLWDKFFDPDAVPSGTDPFSPTGMQSYTYGDTTIADPVTSTDLNSMKDLARKGRVRLIKGDTFITQEGNIYDFGGYWNYNLGNCYVEAHIDQKAELNTHKDYDMLGAGGPDWTATGWRTIYSGSWGGSSNYLFADDTSVWVEKKFGNSYSLVDGDQVTVTKGSVQDVWIGVAENIEKYTTDKFTGDTVKWYSSKYIDGATHEWVYDPLTHIPISYSFSYKWLPNSRGNIFKFSYALASKQSIDLNASLTFAFSLVLAAAVKVGVSVGVGVSIGFSASMKFVLDLGAAMNLKVKGALGGDHTYDINSGKWKSDLKFTQVYKAAKLKAEKEEALIKQRNLQISKNATALRKLAMDLKKADINIENANFFIFS